MDTTRDVLERAVVYILVNLVVVEACRWVGPSRLARSYS
jgi:hypothetical protein